MTTTDELRTGGYIDAFCTKCDMLLGHTILAMVGTKVVKVKCNTCGVDHSYRGEAKPVKGVRTAAPKKAVPTWSQRMKGRNLAAARKYSAKENFQVDDVIVHATFGLGLDTANRGDKIDVMFQAFEKTLVNGKGS
jgi:RNase P subunit RPR2